MEDGLLQKKLASLLFSFDNVEEGFWGLDHTLGRLGEALSFVGKSRWKGEGTLSCLTPMLRDMDFKGLPVFDFDGSSFLVFWSKDSKFGTFWSVGLLKISLFFGLFLLADGGRFRRLDTERMSSSSSSSSSESLITSFLCDLWRFCGVRVELLMGGSAVALIWRVPRSGVVDERVFGDNWMGPPVGPISLIWLDEWLSTDAFRL